LQEEQAENLSVLDSAALSKTSLGVKKGYEPMLFVCVTRDESKKNILKVLETIAKNTLLSITMFK